MRDSTSLSKILAPPRSGALVAIILVVTTGAGRADVCAVPGFHDSVQEAIDDPSCVEIQLADLVFAESLDIRRTLVLAGASAGSTTLEGRIEVAGEGVRAELRDLRVESSCPGGSLDVRAGAEVVGSGLVAVRNDTAPCPALASLIFGDGFESGTTSAWTTVVP